MGAPPGGRARTTGTLVVHAASIAGRGKLPVAPGSFGDLLRKHRLAAGLTQEAVAERAGLSVNGIHKLERGTTHPYRDTAQRLVRALRLSPEEEAVFRTLAEPAGRQRRVGTPFPTPGLTSVRRDLPAALTSFIGREHELAEVRRLLRATRLLTLTGAGGIGKTRLALKVAEEELGTYADGVWLVELASLAESSLVVQAVASTLGVSEKRTEPLLLTLKNTLQAKRLLLVLDNCEHLVVACLELIEPLLRACSGLQVLATSREPLRLDGETAWRVPSLSLPNSNGISPEVSADSEAVALFVERAAASERTFAMTSQNRTAVFQICRRLDGIPLAIELAAARVNALTVEQIAARLDDVLSLLTGGGRTAVDRQRTLRGTLDWSYNLLNKQEQLLLSRLGVFAGGWRLEAAEAVCADKAISTSEVLDLLSNLVSRSLVVAEERGQAAWYRLLDPQRAYALEKLQHSGDAVRMQSCHRDWCVRLAETFEAEWRGPQQSVWSDSLGHEEGNIRAALRSSLVCGEITEGLRLAGALHRFWDLRSRLTEGRAWLAELLGQVSQSTPGSVMAKALSASGFLAAYQGDARTAEAHLAEALRLWRELGNAHGIAGSLNALGTSAQVQNDNTRAEALWAEGLEVARGVKDRVDTYWALCMLARLALRRGDLERARALNDESLTLKQQQGDGFGVSSSLHVLAQLAWLQGENDRAFALVRDSLVLLRDLGHWRAIAMDLKLLAHITADCGQAEQSACLFGAVEVLQDSLGIARSLSAELISDIDAARTEHSLAACRARLTPAELKVAWAAGQAMTTDEVVAFALSAISSDAWIRADDCADHTVRHDSLTDRETEVLRLVADGKSNQEIAASLVLSRRTVERHIANVCAKVGARNRVEATAYALRSGIA